MSNDEIFAAAYREHYWAVSPYVARRLPGRADEVEEVVAEVLTVAWRRRHDLPDAPLPWLYGVARNCLANAVRGYGRRRRLVDRLSNDEAAHGRHVVAGPDTEAPGAWVHEALALLSPSGQEVLRLAAWEELDAEQIAVSLGCGRRAAAMRLHRARRRLRAEIDRMRPAAPAAAPPVGQLPGDAGPMADPARTGDEPPAAEHGPSRRMSYPAGPAVPFREDLRHA
ncbi:sigma-70 family RNA polymerase sigma factor [Streptomyces sp. CG1]|uniref:sigma-70 family RNA polymerase sigma factor n=1 Tax=Streptomyces sp. CG1 TaxID=1287523 RepID=UPI0034E1B5EA